MRTGLGVSFRTSAHFLLNTLSILHTVRNELTFMRRLGNAACSRNVQRVLALSNTFTPSALHVAFHVVTINITFGRVCVRRASVIVVVRYAGHPVIRRVAASFAGTDPGTGRAALCWDTVPVDAGPLELHPGINVAGTLD